MWGVYNKLWWCFIIIIYSHEANTKIRDKWDGVFQEYTVRGLNFMTILWIYDAIEASRTEKLFEGKSHRPAVPKFDHAVWSSIIIIL